MTETETRAGEPLAGELAGDLVTGEGFGAEEGEGPDDAQMRADLRARGHKPSTRGRLGRDWVELWLSGETAPGLEDQDQATGESGGVGPGDFEPDHARQVRTDRERPPSRPKAKRLRDRLGLGDDTGAGKRKSGKEKTGRRAARPKHERVGLERLGEGAFGVLANITRNADPVLSRCFAVEAPLAGYVAERTLAGTPIDRGLQPIARAQLKANVLGALIGLPAGVVLLEQAQGLPPGPRAMREGIILAGMRECAVTLAEFAGEDLAERAARNAEKESLYEEADSILQHILYGVQLGDQDQAGPGSSWPPAAPEDQAAATAQQQATPGGFGFMSPAPAGDPARPQYAHPYPPTPAAIALRR